MERNINSTKRDISLQNYILLKFISESKMNVKDKFEAINALEKLYNYAKEKTVP